MKFVSKCSETVSLTWLQVAVNKQINDLLKSQKHLKLTSNGRVYWIQQKAADFLTQGRLWFIITMFALSNFYETCGFYFFVLLVACRS